MRASRRGSGSSMLAKAGIPLVAMVLGCTFVLSQFMQTHMEIKDKRSKSTSQRKFDLEEEHRLLMKKLDIDNFSLSRIPRPEEEAKGTATGARIPKK